ncbi:hypothetical protein EMIHUDRAFT_104600 [Emiliania huxleyi CCMP1516]|uniref:Isochorismatase-like domain-containing protein n=2 Tax=Emiliania huxleyi TaxID=2903 RepID=A0A0D3IL00_EMIH1|nr:hypothetical protein EMIHUDRAFT_104600 [Emiliania huxleyi CCMP1516]EOD11935.1 hypothetical protein EMIHUDRAFT_104600 [Emiliania huxleyi CCMP1516]|eukprot:XP_005764364.1 hypothetical protein EMIHUDRAFT_104600 [Emiliania huxleyi CCMP1516]
MGSPSLALSHSCCGLCKPPFEPLMEVSADWALADQTRTFCLLVLDMENDYLPYMTFMMPNAEAVLAAFRKAQQPVVWTNWYRQEDDGAYGAIDRFWGPRGLYPPGGTVKGHAENPMWIDTRYGKNATDTAGCAAEGGPYTHKSSAAGTEGWRVRHLSKMADKDEHGDDILYPMLQAWGVDTIVIVGAWTEDCVIATCYEAADRYGLDVVLVTDAIATGSPAACGKTLMAEELVQYFASHRHKLGPAQAELNYGAVQLRRRAALLSAAQAEARGREGISVAVAAVIALMAAAVGAAIAVRVFVRHPLSHSYEKSPVPFT